MRAALPPWGGVVTNQVDRGGIVAYPIGAGTEAVGEPGAIVERRRHGRGAPAPLTVGRIGPQRRGGNRAPWLDEGEEMTIGSRTLVACALGLSGLLAVACDEPMVANDASTDPMMDGGGGGGGNQDGGGGGGGDEDGGGGGGDDDCASRASAYCARFQECNPNGFIGAFENMSICVEVQTEACENPSPYAAQPSDPAGCAAAQAAGCDAFFPGEIELPAACRPAPGPVGRDGDCGSDGQCGMEGTTRLYCRNATNPVCEDGSCFPPTPANSSCSVSSFDPCDTYAGFACVNSWEARDMMGTPGWIQRRCRQIEYGGHRADCMENTEKQCAIGYRCHEGFRRCEAVLGQDDPCDPDHPLCDERLGLKCEWVDADGGGAHLCVSTSIFVPAGAMHGPNQDGVEQKCSAYALPSSDTPPVCVLRKRLGEGCNDSPDNCWPGLECRAGMCQEPEPAGACD